MNKGKEKITMTRDRFHVYLTVALYVGVLFAVALQR